MAFTNLFAGLTNVDQDTKHRSFSDEGQRTRQTEHTGPDSKRQRYEGQRTWTNKAKYPQMSNTEQNKFHNHNRNKAGHSDGMFHRGGRARKNYDQQQQWQQQKNYNDDGQKRQHQFRGGGANHRGRGRNFRGQRRDYQKKPPPVPREKTFSQDFRDQNALMFDGQLVCRHFLWGRCIKGDECQLKHIQGCNDLIKDACKFYIQGFCSKGESCPYMHKSFPCKFFHKGGKCSQGAECKFSHEPLTETTRQLLEKVFQMDIDHANKAKQESQEPAVNTQEPETEVCNIPDVLTLPLRPMFYNKEEVSTEPESLLCKSEEQSEVTEAEAPGGTLPPSPPSPPLDQEPPVCYSVEAVLGPQLFKPFPSFYSAPTPQESLSRSESSAQLCDPVPRADEGPLYSPIVRTETNKPQEKMFKGLPWLQTHTERKQLGEVSASSYGPVSLYSPATPAPDFLSSARKGNTNLHVETSHTVESESAASELRGQTCSSSDPGSTSQPQASGKRLPPPPLPLSSSPHLSEIKLINIPVESAASSTKTKNAQQSQCSGGKILNRGFSHLFADGLKTGSDLTTATSHPRSSSSSSSSPLFPHTRSSDLKPVAEPDTLSDRPFLSLFAAPLSSPPSRPCPSTAASSSHGSDLSKQKASNTGTSPPQQEIQQMPRRSTNPKVSPHLENENDSSKSESRGSEERCGKFQSCTPASHGDGADPPPTQAHQQPLHTASSKGCTAAGAQSSVLKSLFLCLNPFEDDAEPEDAGNMAVASGNGTKEKTNFWVADEEQQQQAQKKKKTRQRLHQPTEDSVSTCTQQQQQQQQQQPPAPQSPPLPVEPAAGPTLGSTTPPGAQVRESGTHKLPFRPVTLLMQRQPRRGAGGRKTVTDVPLKDLFKSLDTTVFKG